MMRAVHKDCHYANVEVGGPGPFRNRFKVRRERLRDNIEGREGGSNRETENKSKRKEEKLKMSRDPRKRGFSSFSFYLFNEKGNEKTFSRDL